MTLLSLEKKAHHDIRTRIIYGEWLPGTWLSENELADRLRMSRTPVRAAISLLESEGIVESVRGRGVIVKDISLREYRNIFEVLTSLQLFALDKAARRALSFDMAELKRHLDRQARAAEEGDHPAYYESHLHFVGTLLSALGNAYMMEMFEKVRGKFLFTNLSYRRLHPNAAKPANALRANLAVYAALERGDLGAAKEALIEVNEYTADQVDRVEM